MVVLVLKALPHRSNYLVRSFSIFNRGKKQPKPDDGAVTIGCPTFVVFSRIDGTNPNVEHGRSRGPGVEVERAVPEVWCSSRSGSRSGEGVAELKSQRRTRRSAEVP